MQDKQDTFVANIDMQMHEKREAEIARKRRSQQERKEVHACVCMRACVDACEEGCSNLMLPLTCGQLLEVTWHPCRSC